MTQNLSQDDSVRAFYERWPFPIPTMDLDAFRDRRMVPRGSPAAGFHLYWPDRAARGDLDILIAGCGTSQAVEYALWNPAARITAIDLSQPSLDHTRKLAEKYGVTNIETHRLAIEEISSLGREFDLISSAGVLHHLPDPVAGLSALRQVLRLDGSIYIMVYARHGRMGLYLFQDYCRKLGLQPNERDLTELAAVLKHIPRDHPLTNMHRQSIDFTNINGLADGFLHPQDRAYTVPEIYDWLDHVGMKMQRWYYQALYDPGCCELAATPHLKRILELPPREQPAAVELFRGHLTKHYMIACRDDRPTESYLIRFDEPNWRGLIPAVLPTSGSRRANGANGVAAELNCSAHEYPVPTLGISQQDLPLLELMDGQRTLEKIATASGLPDAAGRVVGLYQALWQFDLVMFRKSN